MGKFQYSLQFENQVLRVVVPPKLKKIAVIII